MGVKVERLKGLWRQSWMINDESGVWTPRPCSWISGWSLFTHKQGSRVMGDIFMSTSQFVLMTVATDDVGRT